MSCTQSLPANAVKLFYVPPPPAPAITPLPIAETIEAFIEAASSVIRAVLQALVPTALAAFSLYMACRIAARVVAAARQAVEVMSPR
jgi:hypothetical protein